MDSTFRGVEGKASFTLGDTTKGKLRLDLLADYVRAEIDQGGGNVPRIPPYHFGAGLHWDGASIDGGIMVPLFGEANARGGCGNAGGGVHFCRRALRLAA